MFQERKVGPLPSFFSLYCFTFRKSSATAPRARRGVSTCPGGLLVLGRRQSRRTERVEVSLVSVLRNGQVQKVYLQP